MLAPFCEPLASAATHYQLLWSFGAGSDGRSPASQVLQASDGSLYGTTFYGGVSNAGTIYRINRDGSGYRILHEFGTNAAGGANPWSEVLEASDGMLYGTTEYSSPPGAGTLFRMNKDGSGFRKIADLEDPRAGVAEGHDGALYGLDYVGELAFKINKDGTGYANLHTFGGFLDGYGPHGTLVLASDGFF